MTASLSLQTQDSELQPLTNLGFERSLNRVKQDVLRMGALVEQSFLLSQEALFSSNLDALKEINDLENKIDNYYHKIELDCAGLMTLQSPVARDLRILSAFMQLVRDLERIGDYAEDLAEMAIKLVAYPPHPCMPEVETMSRHARAMLADSLQSLTDLDGNAGERVKKLDDTVDDAYDHLYQTLAYQRDIKGVVEPILILGLVIRHLERMADHATNVAQRVSYIATGHRW